MGIEKIGTGFQFGLNELGVLHGPPLRGATTIVNALADLFEVHYGAFLVYDDTAGCVRVRISSRKSQAVGEAPLSASLCDWIRTEDATLAVASTLEETPEAPELKFFGAGAFLGAPVYGPAQEPIGVLAAIHPSPRDWSAKATRQIGDFAHLISQEIMLLASFETLRIMSIERTSTLTDAKN